MAIIDGKQIKPGSIPAAALAVAPVTTAYVGLPDELGQLLAADGLTVIGPDALALAQTAVL
jgi:hypothetical protein